MPAKELPAHSPADFIYERVFAPVDVAALLETAERRGRIRRLPVTQLFFGLTRLEPAEIQQLLPHLTEEQWTGILDLGLWTRDQMEAGEFLRWQQVIIAAEDAVARKLLRAVDDDLWELVFRKDIEIHPLVEEDPAPVGEGREWLETPDGQFVLGLPENAEKSRLLRSLVLRVYELEPERTRRLLLSALARSSVELEEEAYQSRRRRLEDQGFQDYFDAIEIYTCPREGEPLPRKQTGGPRPVSTLPVPVLEGTGGRRFLLEALARIESPQRSQAALEELFFVCNKLLAADGASASRPEEVKEVIAKGVDTMSLGLERWAGGNLERARQGVEEHYLQSYFQLGYSRLLNLQRRVKRIRESPHQPDPGSFLDRFLQALGMPFPRLAERHGDELRLRFLHSLEDLIRAEARLEDTEKGQGGGE